MITKLKNPQQEILLFQKRTLVIACIIGALTLVLIGRLIYLQIMEHSVYRTLSDRNQITVVPIAPKRGLITDRHGRLLADNFPVFSLEIIPSKITDIKTTLSDLENLLHITPDEKRLFLKQLKQRRRLDSVPLRTRLTDDEVALFSVNQYRFPGVIVKGELIRHYPLGPSFVSIIGYIGRINDRDLKELDPAAYSGTNYIGKLGIEKFYESALHGKPGYEQVEMDAAGRRVRLLSRTPPIAGKNLTLSIDSNLQLSTEAAMEDRAGAAVAIDPKTGEVLALVSHPSYDPNQFVAGMRSVNFKQLRDDPAKPLYNRALRGQYPPGSVVKPFLALGGLETGVITPEYGISDPGWFYLKNSSHQYRDWKRTGHGWVDLTRAISQSCDIYFFQLAMKLGIRQLYNTLYKFGLGHKTGIGSHEELPGLLPSPEWKKRVQKKNWYPGDTVITGIGQGFMLTTPLQLASATATLANRGQGMQPTFLLGDKKPLPPISLPPETWGVVIQAMQKVISEGTGGKYYGRNAKYTVAGKTGTAQVFSLKGQKYNAASLPKHLHDHTWFIAFAPVEDPKIAVAVILENNTGAGTIARQMIDQYLVPKPASKPKGENPIRAAILLKRIFQEQ